MLSDKDTNKLQIQCVATRIQKNVEKKSVFQRLIWFDAEKCIEHRTNSMVDTNQTVFILNIAILRKSLQLEKQAQNTNNNNNDNSSNKKSF